MKDKAEEALIRSYRGTVESYRRLVTVAEQLVEAQRGERSISEIDLTDIQEQLIKGRHQIEQIDLYLALWPDGNESVH